MESPDFVNRNPLGPILASTSCRFRAPLAFPDQLSVGARVARIDEDRFVMFYAVYSHRLQKIAAEGEGTRLTIHQGPFPAFMAEMSETGWGQSLFKLAALLATPAKFRTKPEGADEVLPAT